MSTGGLKSVLIILNSTLEGFRTICSFQAPALRRSWYGREIFAAVLIRSNHIGLRATWRPIFIFIHFLGAVRLGYSSQRFKDCQPRPEAIVSLLQGRKDLLCTLEIGVILHD
jgi:hypothetical protein